MSDRRCAPDDCVVETAPVARVLETWVSRWRAERPSLRGRRNLPVDAVEPVGPYEWLAADTGLTEDEIKRARWPNRRPTVELRIADAIVASIGDPGMFYDGTLTPRHRVTGDTTCCGGSTPDSLTG